MMLVTWASGPPSCSTMLPQKFSATATLNRPELGGPDVEHALKPTAASTAAAIGTALILRMVLIRSTYGPGQSLSRTGTRLRSDGKLPP